MDGVGAVAAECAVKWELETGRAWMTRRPLNEPVEASGGWAPWIRPLFLAEAVAAVTSRVAVASAHPAPA